MTDVREHLDFDSIRYLNNVPLAVHCIQLELKCDYDTAALFARWHYEHMQHMFSVLLNDSRFTAVNNENAVLKKKNIELNERLIELSSKKPEHPADKVIQPKAKKSFWDFLKRLPCGEVAA